MGDAPLLVFGPRSTTYDFGALHPLTPRRFGPGIDLLRAVGAEPGLAPEPASDAEIRLVHREAYVAAVRRFSEDPSLPPAFGIGPGDDPAFSGMHEAGATVAGGSLRAAEALLRGDAIHAFHPGGGLHHAMPDRASGFCIYNDAALAVASARRAGLRVLYVDLDVHHGDGVQAIHGDDPGVMTISFHESGRYLFPGTGSASEIGRGEAAGTVVNVPLDPGTGDDGWLAAVETLLPALAESFGPDVVVSQHGADTHAWDPLAHLRLTTRAMSRAARLVDEVAHREAGGRWLATGGGGYDAYRVVPRAWALTWLAGAHRELPAGTPAAWRDRWSAEAVRWGQAPLPESLLDEPNAGLPADAGQRDADRRASDVAAAVAEAIVPRLVRAAAERGWGRARASVVARSDMGNALQPTVIQVLGPADLDRLHLAERVVAPAAPPRALAILRDAAADGAIVTGAVVGDVLVGVAVIALPAAAAPVAGETHTAELLALGVAPDFRRRGVGGRLLAAAVSAVPAGVELRTRVTVGERDPIDPLDITLRREIARRMLERAGFAVRAAVGAVAGVDRDAVEARRR